jgi:hypothetical protein
MFGSELKLNLDLGRDEKGFRNNSLRDFDRIMGADLPVFPVYPKGKTIFPRSLR